MRGFWLFVALGLLLAAVWASSYGGRVHLRDSQLKGCMRGRADRADNAAGWAAAARVRRESARRETDAVRRRIDFQGARRYQLIAVSLRSRIVDCDKAFPAPKPIEWTF